VETYEKRDGSQGVKAVVKNGTVGLLERGKGGQGGSQGGWATPGGSNNFGPSRGQQTPQAWDESEVPF
jgi:ADP-ribose pyrophosphatase YjhB (NUDIX family)